MNETRPMINRVQDSEVASSVKKHSKTPWILLVIVILLVGGGIVLFRDKLFSKSGDSGAKDKPVASSGYQSVFLTNGQVYFGKISDIGSSWITLKDIYYLQVAQAAQGQQTQSQEQPKISLVKLGNELHGPEDEMKINKDQILFYEEMKENAKVIEAIREYQKNPEAANGNANSVNQSPAQNLQQQAPATNSNTNK